VRVTLAAYAAATTLAAPVLRLTLTRRVARGKEIAGRLGERRGIDATPRPEGLLLWLHCASMGETISILPVLSAFVPMFSDGHVLLTTGTVTSAGLLATRLPELGLAEHVLHRFVPLDVPRWAARFLDHWRPDAAAFVESEIWPNLLHACRRRDIPTMLVNARISPDSFRRWRRVPGLARALFSGFRRVVAQSDDDATRLRALGAGGVSAPGNLKFAAAPLPVRQDELERLQARLAGRPTWLAASTHPGEEHIAFGVHDVLRARHPRLLTIIVPRHPSRGAAIAKSAGNWPTTRRAIGADPPDESGIYVADTLGELGIFYTLVGHAFVGGSLIPHGGQNPLEPARLGCPVAVGPHTSNFNGPVATLEQAGALTRVSDAADLARWVESMLLDPALRARMGDAGIVASRRYADLPVRVATMLADLVRRRPRSA
jgi:3-deoxy-D-manno-octulosonic-acid transferase